MNFPLLWLEILLAALLWVAAWGAWIGRARTRWVRGGLWTVVVLIPLLVLAVLVTTAAFIKFGLKLELNWFYYFAWLLAVYAVGAAVIVLRAGRRHGGERPAAAFWPRGGLALAWLIAVVMGYITLGNMDQAVRGQCALQAVKANSLYLATLPAIVSEDQNAAPLYEKAMARLKADPPTHVLNPPFGDRENFVADDPTTLAYLKRHSRTIALLRQAAAMPACRFDWELANPDINKALGLADMRTAAYLLNLDARQAIARGNPAEAVVDAAAIYGMSRAVGQGMLVSSLVGIGIDALGNKTLESTLPDVSQAKDLQSLNMKQLMPLGRMLQQALRGEERFGLAAYSSMPDFLPSWQKEPLPAIKLVASAPGIGGQYFRVFWLDVDVYVNLMTKAQQWAVEPFYTIRSELPAGRSGHRKGLLTSLMEPTMTNLFEVLGREEAQDECARAAVAMTRYRLDHGKLPSRLYELVPKYLEAIPADPFNGQPVRLVVKKDQWIIYSVGPDGVDDAGVEYNTSGKGDVIFTLTMPK